MKTKVKNRSKNLLVRKDLTVKEAMRCMSDIGQKELFIIDDQNKLFGALSDGDIRKWILNGGSLEERVDWICNKKPKSVKEQFEILDVKKLMMDFKIESIPVITERNEVKEVLVWDKVFAGKVSRQKGQLTNPVVIMAGGQGSRLDPFTKILPKPLIPIGEKPIITIIMEKFNEYKINDYFVSVNHKSKMIKSYFEDSNLKFNITFIEEDKPLGTVGSLAFIKDKIKEDIIVTNCDVIIESDYSELVKFHNDNANDLTMVVSCRHYVIPYGVCEIENGGSLKKLKEKPEYDLLVNTGMYVMNKRVLNLIPANRRFNINDLIAKAKKEECKIGVFPINEKSWIDVGQWEEYHKALKGLGI